MQERQQIGKRIHVFLEKKNPAKIKLINFLQLLFLNIEQDQEFQDWYGHEDILGHRKLKYFRKSEETSFLFFRQEVFLL